MRFSFWKFIYSSHLLHSDGSLSRPPSGFKIYTVCLCKMYFCFGCKCITKSAFFTACPQQLWHMCLLINPNFVIFLTNFHISSGGVHFLTPDSLRWATDQRAVISCSVAHTHTHTCKHAEPMEPWLGSEINTFWRTALGMSEGRMGVCSFSVRMQSVWRRAAWVHLIQ